MSGDEFDMSGVSSSVEYSFESNQSELKLEEEKRLKLLKQLQLKNVKYE